MVESTLNVFALSIFLKFSKNLTFTFFISKETFPNEFTSGDGKPPHKEFGHFYGSAYATSPTGLRTPEMSRRNDGLLIAKIDLNLCRQTKDHWGFRLTQRLDLYGKTLAEAAKPDYEPQIIKG